MKYDNLKNILYSSIISLEFHSISNKFIYKILSLPNKDSEKLNKINANNNENDNFYYSKSKYLSKDSLCIPKNINLENNNIHNSNNTSYPYLMKNNIYTKSGTNFLNLIKSFFEEGRSFNNNFNNKNPLPINFFFKIIKKSNLILGIKLIPISNKEISINKIILYDNFKIFEKNKLIENNKIIFEKTEGNLIDNYFEIKLLEMNIIGNNFIYEIEFNYTNENELILLETYKYSCNLIEEFSYDENFELFFNEFNSNIINDSTNGYFLLNINFHLCICIVFIFGFID